MSVLFGASLTTAQATVTTSAARLVAVSNAAPRANGGILIKSIAANTQLVYIGDSTVTSSTGFPLDVGGTVSVPIDDPSKIYAVSASGTQTIAILYI